MAKKWWHLSIWSLSISGLIGPLALGLGALSSGAQPSNAPNRVIEPAQVPTARYARGEAVDLSLIIDEWRDRYPNIPIFACSCDADSCGDKTKWPYREFARYQPFVALGNSNGASSEDEGFNCFDIDSGNRPES
jgi:hypothetical protein